MATKVASMGVDIAVMTVVGVGEPGRRDGSNRGSSGGDCVGNCRCYGLVKNVYIRISLPFLTVFIHFLSPKAVPSGQIVLFRLEGP